MGVRIPPGSGIVPQSATFDSGTVKFQYYFDGGPWDGGGSPSTFSVPGSMTMTPSERLVTPQKLGRFSPCFTVTVSGNQIIFDYLHKTRWSPSITSLEVPGPENDPHALYIASGVLISSVALIPSFTKVTLDPSSILSTVPYDLFPNNVTWSTDAVAVTWAGETYDAGDKIVLDVSSTPFPADLPGSGHPNT
jgi:hypothetical protein